MVKIKYRYIVGTHIMFYEIEMAKEHIQSIVNAVNEVENKENITVDLFFNLSEYFERVNANQITHPQLKDKFNELVKMVEETGATVNPTIYDDFDPISMVDYRRDLNYNGCKNHDYVIWGETDCLLPKEMFTTLESIKEYANSQDIHRYVTTFAVRKMWDDSWKPLEHVDFEDARFYELSEPEAFTEQSSIRYTMSIDEMNEINSRAKDIDVRITQQPQFDGSGLVLSSDLIKNGVNVPHCIFGHLVDDTSIMSSCKQIMGEAYIQFIVKNILKVHNRNNPKKRMYALEMLSDDKSTQKKKGEWFFKIKTLVHANLGTFGKSQARFNTYKDFEKMIGRER